MSDMDKVKIYSKENGEIVVDFGENKVTIYDPENDADISWPLDEYNLPAVMTDHFMNGLSEMTRGALGSVHGVYLEHCFELGTMYLKGEAEYKDIAHDVELTIKEALAYTAEGAKPNDNASERGAVASDEMIQHTYDIIMAVRSAIGGDRGEKLREIDQPTALGFILKPIAFDRVLELMAAFNRYDITDDTFKDNVMYLLKQPCMYRPSYRLKKES